MNVFNYEDGSGWQPGRLRGRSGFAGVWILLFAVQKQKFRRSRCSWTEGPDLFVGSNYSNISSMLLREIKGCCAGAEGVSEPWQN
jgi:hypothetical protein